MSDLKLYPASKAGRCSNGFERDHGTVVHAVLLYGPDTFAMGKALCGTQPGRRSAGWSTRGSQAVTCARCAAKVAREPVTPVAQ